MTKLTFESNYLPTAVEITAVSNVTPWTSFNTVSYAAARTIIGYKPCTLVLKSGSEVVGGCLGFLKRGILSSSLELITSPKLLEPKIFWDGILNFCHKKHVWDLFIETFASEVADIPSLLGELSRRVRYEFILDLTSSDLFQNMSKSHERNIARAQKSGLIVKRTRELNACQTHLELMQASMKRRLDRGEDIMIPRDKRFFEALLTTGSGEIFQAYYGDKPISSIMLVKSKYCAYNQSGGTSKEGMEKGASAFLLFEVAKILKKEGIQIFNLGGTGIDEEGLYYFKSGFGTRIVKLESLSVSIASPLKRKLRTAAKLIIRDPLGFISALIKIERFVVFSANPANVSISNRNDKEQLIDFRKITDEELAGLSQTIEYHEQAERFQRLGFNSAYGLFVNGKLAHIAWLIDEEMDQKNIVRNVRLKPGEMEITHCYTGKEYRGKGFYPLSIYYLCQIAASKKIKKIFMTTGVDNIASQHGIKKAGFYRCGMIWRIIFPLAPKLCITLRGHRIFKNK